MCCFCEENGRFWCELFVVRLLLLLLEGQTSQQKGWQVQTQRSNGY